MNFCTTMVQKWKYVEVVAATIQSSAKWGRCYYFEHCGAPAVHSREGTHWCAYHNTPKQPKEDA